MAAPSVTCEGETGIMWTHPTTQFVLASGVSLTDDSLHTIVRSRQLSFGLVFVSLVW